MSELCASYLQQSELSSKLAESEAEIERLKSHAELSIQKRLHDVKCF